MVNEFYRLLKECGDQCKTARVSGIISFGFSNIQINYTIEVGKHWFFLKTPPKGVLAAGALCPVAFRIGRI